MKTLRALLGVVIAAIIIGGTVQAAECPPWGGWSQYGEQWSAEQVINFYAKNYRVDPNQSPLDRAIEAVKDRLPPRKDSNPYTPMMRQNLAHLECLRAQQQKGTAGAKCNTVGQFSAASPVPMDSRGTWAVFSAQKNRIYQGITGTQVEAAQTARDACVREGGGRCIELGGCVAPGQFGTVRGQAIAVAGDHSWAWLSCGNSKAEAWRLAKELCELKMRCPCLIEDAFGD